MNAQQQQNKEYWKDPSLPVTLNETVEDDNQESEKIPLQASTVVSLTPACNIKDNSKDMPIRNLNPIVDAIDKELISPTQAFLTRDPIVEPPFTSERALLRLPSTETCFSKWSRNVFRFGFHNVGSYQHRHSSFNSAHDTSRNICRNENTSRFIGTNSFEISIKQKPVPSLTPPSVATVESNSNTCQYPPQEQYFNSNNRINTATHCDYNNFHHDLQDTSSSTLLLQSATSKGHFFFKKALNTAIDYHLLCLLLTSIILFWSISLILSFFSKTPKNKTFEAHQIFDCVMLFIFIYLYIIEVLTSSTRKLLSQMNSCPHVSSIINEIKHALPTLEVCATCWHLTNINGKQGRTEKYCQTEVVEFGSSRDISDPICFSDTPASLPLNNNNISTIINNNNSSNTSCTQKEKVTMNNDASNSRGSRRIGEKSSKEHYSNSHPFINDGPIVPDPFTLPEFSSRLPRRSPPQSSHHPFEDVSPGYNVTYSSQTQQLFPATLLRQSLQSNAIDNSMNFQEGPTCIVVVDATLICHYADLDTEERVSDVKNKLKDLCRWKDEFLEINESISIPGFTILRSSERSCVLAPMICKVGEREQEAFKNLSCNEDFTRQQKRYKSWDPYSLPMYLLFSFLFLSWPYRMLLESRITRVHWIVRKLVSLHHDILLNEEDLNYNSKCTGSWSTCEGTKDDNTV